MGSQEDEFEQHMIEESDARLKRWARWLWKRGGWFLLGVLIGAHPATGLAVCAAFLIWWTFRDDC